jgi:hypothetical protein
MANWSGIGEGTLASGVGYPTAKQGGPNFKDKSGGRVINTIFTEVNATDSAYLINPNTLARWTTTRTNGGFAGISTGAASDKDGFIRYTTFTMDRPLNDVVKDGTNNPTSITGVVNVDTGNIFDATKDNAVFVSTGRLSDLDPRLKANVTERTNGVNPRNYLNDTWFTSTDFRGAMRDNNWLAGWSILETLGVFASTANVTQPQVNLSVANGKTYVTFYAEDGIRYSIETSQKNVRYTSLESITGAGANVTREISPTTGKLYVRILPL